MFDKCSAEKVIVQWRQVSFVGLNGIAKLVRWLRSTKLLSTFGTAFMRKCTFSWDKSFFAVHISQKPICFEVLYTL